MLAAQTKLKSMVIEATITRADGTVEATQTIAFWHANPLKRLAWTRRRPVTHKSETKKDTE